MASPTNMSTNSECFTALQSQQMVGLIFSAQAGLISCTAVMLLWGIILYKVIRRLMTRVKGVRWSPIRTHIDVYFFSLVCADFMHGFGMALDFRWVRLGKVFCGPFCTIQGILRNAGATGVAMAQLAIAVHTFMAIFFQWIPPRTLRMPLFIITVTWLYIVLNILIESVTHKHYFAPTPYWCWISTHIQDSVSAKIIAQYLWLWLAAIVSIVLYTPLFFLLRGNIHVDPQVWWRIKFHRRTDYEGFEFHSESAKEARSMLLYPVCYTILVLPLTIIRWTGYKTEAEGGRVPFASALASVVIFALSGLVNVTLFMFTRSNLLHLGFDSEDKSKASMESRRSHRDRDTTALQRSVYEADLADGTESEQAECRDRGVSIVTSRSDEVWYGQRPMSHR